MIVLKFKPLLIKQFKSLALYVSYSVGVLAESREINGASKPFLPGKHVSWKLTGTNSFLCNWVWPGGTHAQRQRLSSLTILWLYLCYFFLIKVWSLHLSFIFCILSRKHIWFRYLLERNHIKVLMSSHLKLPQCFLEIVNIYVPASPCEKS